MKSVKCETWGVVIALLVVGLACGAPSVLTPSPLPTRLLPTRTPELRDTGWLAVGAGLEARRLLVQTSAGSDRLWLARVDPPRVRLRVLYEPTSQRTVRDWFDAAGARLAVNAGYFTPAKNATALIVSDGIRRGRSYVGFGGMFSVSNGWAQVRSLIAHPYSPDEPLDQAVQSFPMLIHAGGQAATIDDNGQVARRTAIGQDRAGRIVFVVSAMPVFSLKTLSAFLAASDLDLDVALNLDGGTSSGLWYRDEAGNTAGVDSWVYVPAVIVVE